MAKKHFDWECKPELEQHTKVKHDIIRDYIVEYIKVYAKMPYVENLPIAFIDGFCGGGQYWYQNKSTLVSGSPLIMLEAGREAEAAVNQTRKSIKFNLKGEYFFVDKDANALESLKNTIKEGIFNELLIAGTIKLINKSFEACIGTIIQQIPSNRRAIFLLDQYGYTDVTAQNINAILHALPQAEIILNFNVDSLLTYFNQNNFENFQKKTRFINERSPVSDLYKSIFKENNSTKHRYIIQKYIYDSIVRSCGASFYESFFINNPYGRGSYWLIHMSRKPIARHVMNQLAWDKYGNELIQYAGEGLDRYNMLGYNPKHDERLVAGTLETFDFDDDAKKSSLNLLVEQIPRILLESYNLGIRVDDFINSTCNDTGASKEHYLEVMSTLHAGNELILVDGSGKPCRKSKKATDDLVLVPTNQKRIIF